MLAFGKDLFGTQYETANTNGKERVNLVLDLIKYNALLTELSHARQSTKTDLRTQIPRTLCSGALATAIYCSGSSGEYPLMFKIKTGYLCYCSYLVYDGITKVKKLEESIIRVSRVRDETLIKLLEIFGSETTEDFDKLKFDNPHEWKSTFSRVGLEELNIDEIASSHIPKNRST